MNNGESIAREIHKAFDRDMLIETLVTLLKVPTNVPPGKTFIDPDDPKLVYYVQEILKPILNDLNFKDLVVDEMNNLIMRFGSNHNGRRLLMMAYTVAQHSNLMTDPFSGKIADGEEFGFSELCAFGQGASQNKGALAALIGALKVIRNLGASLNGQLIVAINNEGYSSHTCSKQIIEGQHIEADSCILCIGTENRIALGNRGRVDVNIEIKGKSCHSSQPWRGLNAIEGANQVINRLRTISFPEEHPLVGSPQVTVYQAIFSPIAPHTIPDTAHLTIDRRLLPGEDPDWAVQDIRETIGDLRPFELNLKKGVFMYPAEIPSDSEIVQVLQEAYLNLVGHSVRAYYPQWTFDAGYPAHRGIATVQFGPSSTDPAGDDLLGTDFITLSQVETAAKAYAYVILRMLM